MGFWSMIKQILLFPFRTAASLYTLRELIYHFTKREFVGRYRGAHLGILLSLASPLFLLAVYSIVFGVIFKGSFGEEASGKPFPILLFSGLIFFQLFSDTVGRAPSLLASNPNFITKVVFPLEVLPVAMAGSALLHFLVSLLVLIIGGTLWTGTVPLTLIALPGLVIVAFFLALGTSWILSALGLYFRDIDALIPPALMALTFLSAIFYPLSAIPEAYRWLACMNPLACISEMARQILVLGTWPSSGLWIYTIVSAVSILWIGYAVFTRLKKGFSDAL